jgi:hypothetical protein
MILLYSGFSLYWFTLNTIESCINQYKLNTTESWINQYKLNPEYNRIMYKPVQTELWIQQNLIHDSVVFRIQFVLLYTWFCCIQDSVCTGLYMILLYSGFSLYWFIHDSVVFRVQFVLIYTWFCCIQGSVCSINQYKLNPEYNRIMYKPVQTEPWIQQNHV